MALLARAGERALRGAALMSDPSLEGITDGVSELMLAKVEVGSAVFLVRADAEMWESVLDIFA
jgi:hypothetical protein